MWLLAKHHPSLLCQLLLDGWTTSDAGFRRFPSRLFNRCDADAVLQVVRTKGRWAKMKQRKWFMHVLGDFHSSLLCRLSVQYVPFGETMYFYTEQATQLCMLLCRACNVMHSFVSVLRRILFMLTGHRASDGMPRLVRCG